MNLKKKDPKEPILYQTLVVVVALLAIAIVSLMVACIPMGIVWFVLVGILEYSIPVRVIYWCVYGLTLLFTIVMMMED
ncbi:UNVERIFIED_ORG: putative membrane protein [Xanthomonas phage Xoo-sp15]